LRKPGRISAIEPAKVKENRQNLSYYDFVEKRVAIALCWAIIRAAPQGQEILMNAGVAQG